MYIYVYAHTVLYTYTFCLEEHQDTSKINTLGANLYHSSIFLP